MHFSSAFNSKSAQILLLYPQEQYTYYIKIAEYMCMMCICMYMYWLFTYNAYDIQLYFTSTQCAGNIHVHVHVHVLTCMVHIPLLFPAFWPLIPGNNIPCCQH